MNISERMKSAVKTFPSLYRAFNHLRGQRLVWFALPFAVVIFHYADHFTIHFIFGMAIAYYQERIRSVPWSAPLTVILLTVAIFLLSYRALSEQDQLIIMAWSVGATCVVIAVLRSPVAERLLDNKAGAMLGYLSFPFTLCMAPFCGLRAV